MSIEIKNVNYLYSQGTSYEMHALKNVNLEIPDGQFVGLIGHTGSGKSTLTQHLNGLVKATSGHIYYNGEDIYDEKFSMKKLRSKVGLVFQYPEHQLFETEVLADVWQKQPFGWSGWEKSMTRVLLLSCPADRSVVWLSLVCWLWTRKY